MPQPILRRLSALAVAAGLAAVPAVALAATKNGITPVSPKPGSSVPAGKAVTFKIGVQGPGTVWVHVCRSAKKSSKDGTICSRETIGQAKGKAGVFSYTQKVYGYDAYWLNRPGTYSWQAHRIACIGSSSDCRQEGPVVTFRVR